MVTMPKTTPAAAAQSEPEYGVAKVLDREIKLKKLDAEQLLVADMMARRLQRLGEQKDGDGRIPQDNWLHFLNGTRRLLDWISDQFVEVADLEWFEEQILTRKLTLDAIGPLMTAMGGEAPKPTNRRARRAAK